MPNFPPLRALLLDLDGVLWRDTHPIGDLAHIFNQIADLRLAALLVSNNSARSVTDTLKKAASFGLTLQPEQVLHSSEVTAHYLSQHYPQGGALYIIGEEGLHTTLRAAGFQHQPEAPIGNVLAVVAGIDRNITYEKLAQATLHIRAGTPFIGTNPDATYPTPRGLEPGAGSILAALQAATNVSPLIMGKPMPPIFLTALQRLNLRPQQALMVGDRLETDIAGAQQVGLRSALVLSGVTTLQQAQQWQPAPHFIAADLSDLLTQLKKEIQP
ncbi:MAG: HAD-IIA family hydrolase [Anaerolineales bacterium]